MASNFSLSSLTTSDAASEIHFCYHAEASTFAFAFSGQFRGAESSALGEWK